MTTVVIILILVVEVAIYFVKPSYFFLYWLAIQPFILPVFFIFWGDSMMPMEDNYLPKLYFKYPFFMSGLMLILSCVSYVRKKTAKVPLRFIVVPLILLLSFLCVQNLMVGLSIGALYKNVINVFWSIAPFALLLIDIKIRPRRKSLFMFIGFFVIIQLVFSILNLVGYKIYGFYSGYFDDSLICGTFTRYNHMANYLSSFFLILSYEYNEYKSLNFKSYLLLSLTIGILIFMSGSRMALILYSLSALYFFVLFQGKRIVIITLSLLFSLFAIYVIGNDTFWGQKADDGPGFERNLIGLIDLVNSDDLSEGSTLAMSAYLFMDKFKSPFIGNGRAYRVDYFYGHPSDSWNNQYIYMTDARLAFMFVDYGILGLILFIYFYSSFFKGCYLYSGEHRKILYWGAGLYFFLFSITDNGYWDLLQFSIILIYAFSTKSKCANINLMNKKHSS